MTYDVPQVRLLLGDDIKGFGEESRRGRRRHIAYATQPLTGRWIRFEKRANGRGWTTHIAESSGNRRAPFFPCVVGAHS
jgi:hypothetical protein